MLHYVVMGRLRPFVGGLTSLLSRSGWKEVLPLGTLRVVLIAAMLPLMSCGEIFDRVSAQASEKSISRNDDLYTRPRKFIMAGRYEDANNLLNTNLARDYRNAKLHFLNGMAYHFRALQGDKSYLQMAEVGYKTALRLDPGNAHYAYCLGLLNISVGNYQEAVDFLAQSIRYDSTESASLRAFAVASYQALRPDLAYAVSSELVRRDGKDEEALRLKALSAAALGLSADAVVSAKTIQSDDTRGLVMRRVGEWERAYEVASLGPVAPSTRDSDQRIQVADAIEDMLSRAKARNAGAGSGSGSDTDSLKGDVDSKPLALDPNKPAPKMAMIDLIIIQTEETGQLIMGVNLLDALAGSAQVVAGSVRSALEGGVFNFPAGDGGSGMMLRAGTTLGSQVTLASAAYSLNIANSNVTKNDILARPTLVVTDNQTSTFNAGYTLSVALAGNIGAASSLVDKNIGLKLSLTPTFLQGDMVALKIAASRSFFTPVELNARTFSQSVEQSIMEMTSSAVVKMGTTLILSGLTERQLQVSRSQVPVLGEIPILQYIFGSRIETDKTRSIMILITPRLTKEFTGALSLSNDDSPSVKSLKASESRWFGIKESPNYIQMMHHLVSNKLYQEYRTGDVMTETWQRPSSQAGRLERLLQFLNF